MILIAIILIFIAGISDGICDSIAQHDGYAKYGYWWSIDSWKMPKFTGMFAPNMWHIFKFLMVLSFISASICCLYDMYQFVSWWYVVTQYLIFTIFFAIGFKISYK